MCWEVSILRTTYWVDSTVPLRLLTRAVTYSLVFGIGYALGLGFFLD